ncbi:MAG: pilus assembly protein, partial [Rhodospirillales bacterium]
MVLGLADCLKRLCRDTRGTPAIEFAFAAPVMFLMLIATLEIGMVLFVTTLMEGALRDASRYGITGAAGAGGVSRTEQIIAIVGNRTIGLVDLNEANIELLVYPDFG